MNATIAIQPPEKLHTDMCVLAPTADGVRRYTGVQIRADEDPYRVYLASVSEGSRPGLRGRLEKVAQILSSGGRSAEFFPWHECRAQHAMALRAKLQEQDFAVGYVNVLLSSFRGIIRTAWIVGRITSDERDRTIDAAKAVRGESLPAGRALSTIEIQKLFTACKRDKGPAGIRDAAVIALLYGGGLRRSELTALELKDLDLETLTLRVLKAKGSKQREVPLPSGCRQPIENYLAIRGTEPGALVCRTTKGTTGELRLQPITSHSVYELLKRRARQAHVKGFSPHDVRRSYATQLLDAGGDIVHVQHLMGHSTVSTTQRYDRRPAAARAKTAQLLPCPF